MFVDRTPQENAAMGFQRPGLSFGAGRYNGYNPLYAGNQPAPGRAADWNWLSLHFSAMQSSLQSGAAINTSGQTFQNVRIFGLALPDQPQGQILFPNAINQVTSSSSLFWDNANSLLKFGQLTSVTYATSTGYSLFFIGTGQVTFNSTVDNILQYGYNWNPATQAKNINSEPYLKVSMEADYNNGSSHAMEYNMDYLSADGLTQKRPMIMGVDRSTHTMYWSFITDFQLFDNNVTSGNYTTLNTTGTTFSITPGKQLGTGLGSFQINAGQYTFTASKAGTIQWLFQNTSTNSGANTQLFLQTASGAAGNPSVVFEVSGVADWTVGVHNSTSLFKICYGTFGSSDVVTINSSLVTSFGGAVKAITDNSYDIGANGANRFRSMYWGTQLLSPNGSVGTPGYSFTAATSTGMFFDNGQSGVGFCVGGTQKAVITSNWMAWGITGNAYYAYIATGTGRISTDSAGLIGWTGTAGDASATLDTILSRDGAGILALKNSNNAQTFRTYAGNGANLGIVTVNESLTIAAAATTDSSTTIPAGAVILAVAVRVTTVIPTAATFTVTAATGGNTFSTAAVSTAAGSTDLGSAAGALYTSAGTKVRITPNLTPGAATGVVRLAIMYYLPTAPTS